MQAFYRKTDCTGNISYLAGPVSIEISVPKGSVELTLHLQEKIASPHDVPMYMTKACDVRKSLSALH